MNEWKLYEKCIPRIQAKGEGTCEPWYFDYIKCVDKCVRLLCRARCAGAGGVALAARRCARDGCRCARYTPRVNDTDATRSPMLQHAHTLFPPQAAGKIFATLK